MKKLYYFIMLMASVAFSAVAQTNTWTWGQEGQYLWDNTIGSSNMVYAPFFGRKLSGDANEIGVAAFYNFNTVVSAGGGFVRQWQPSGRNAPDTFQLNISLQLKETIQPFETFGVTNFAFTVWGSTAVGTPFKGSNSGNLMNANCVGVVVQIWQWDVGKKVITLDLDGFYQNQTGSGYYNGNWIAAGPSGGIDDASGPPLSLRFGIKF